MLHLVLFFIFGALSAWVGRSTCWRSGIPSTARLSLIVVMGSLAVHLPAAGRGVRRCVQVIVYAGAVMVLFVFVIMLLNAGIEEQTPHGSRVATMLGVPALIIGLSIGIWVVSRLTGLDKIGIGGPTVMNGTRGFGNPQAVGHLLFRQFLLPFEVTSILILIAIMGAVVLARREE